MNECAFCELDVDVIWESDHLVAFRDRYPVTPGHTLIISRRHVGTWFDLDEAERAELTTGIEAVSGLLRAEFAVDAFNVGFNAGEAAGQTVHHFHLHVIPRRHGDMEDPRGGVRGVIPDKQTY